MELSHLVADFDSIAAAHQITSHFVVANNRAVLAHPSGSQQDIVLELDGELLTIRHLGHVECFDLDDDDRPYYIYFREIMANRLAFGIVNGVTFWVPLPRNPEDVVSSRRCRRFLTRHKVEVFLYSRPVSDSIRFYVVSFHLREMATRARLLVEGAYFKDEELVWQRLVGDRAALVYTLWLFLRIHLGLALPLMLTLLVNWQTLLAFQGSLLLLFPLAAFPFWWRLRRQYYQVSSHHLFLCFDRNKWCRIPLECLRSLALRKLFSSRYGKITLTYQDDGGQVKRLSPPMVVYRPRQAYKAIRLCYQELTGEEL